MGFLSKFKKNELAVFEKQLSVPKDHIILKPSYKAYTKASAVYYNGMEEIEAMWAVIANLDLYSTKESDALIKKCDKNIRDLDVMLKYAKAINYDSNYPPHVPAYVRLAMLYEKREEYESGIAVCVEAIKNGAISDGSKGKMYGRLARLIKKSGIIPPDDIIKMMNKI